MVRARVAGWVLQSHIPCHSRLSLGLQSLHCVKGGETEAKVVVSSFLHDLAFTSLKWEFFGWENQGRVEGVYLQALGRGG